MWKKQTIVIEKFNDMVKNSETQIQILYDHLPNPVEIYSRSGKLIKANKASERFWEISTNKTHGKLNILNNPVDINAPIVDYIHKAFKGEVVELDTYEIDPGFYNWKEGPKWLKSNIYPIQDQGGSYNNIIIIHEELTELQNMHSELSTLKQTKQKSDQLRDAFLGIISHELRTPLNWIMGFSDLIRNEKPSDKIDEFTSIINRSGKVLLSIIESLIDISMIEVDEIRVNKNEFRVTELLQEIRDHFNNDEALLNNNIEFRIKPGLEADQYSVFTDREKLKKIIINLVNNALKFTKEGFVEIGYNIKDDKNLLFYVKDSGIGIPKDQYHFIFEKFRKIDETETRTYSGTGLGLSVSKGFVEKLGGNLWVESNPGKGSSFFFNLPAKAG